MTADLEYYWQRARPVARHRRAAAIRHHRTRGARLITTVIIDSQSSTPRPHRKPYLDGRRPTATGRLFTVTAVSPGRRRYYRRARGEGILIANGSV